VRVRGRVCCVCAAEACVCLLCFVLCVCVFCVWRFFSNSALEFKGGLEMYRRCALCLWENPTASLFAPRSHARNASHIPPKRTPPTTQNPIPCPINGVDPNRVNPKPKPTQNQKPKPRTKQKQRQAEPHKKLDKKLSSSSALFPRTLRSTRNTWHVRGHISEEATRASRTTRSTQGPGPTL
jgi:hypothetical protein